jgi:hypothetical protein
MFVSSIILVLVATIILNAIDYIITDIPEKTAAHFLDFSQARSYPVFLNTCIIAVGRPTGYAPKTSATTVLETSLHEH